MQDGVDQVGRMMALAAVEPSVAPCSMLSSMPGDSLDLVASRLLDDYTGGAGALARLAATCHSLRSTFSADFAGSKGRERGIEGIRSLEGLAVLEWVTALGVNRIYFNDGLDTLRPGSSVYRLDEFAELLRRHPRLHCCVEGHTGAAPRRYADVEQEAELSERRALAVATALRDRAERAAAAGDGTATIGLTARLAYRGWRDTVVRAAGWTNGGIESRHAEVFFRLGGVEMPPRSDAYGMARVNT